MNKIVALIIVAMSANVFAADPAPANPTDAAKAEMMKKYEAFAAPGDAHKKMAEYAGEWNYVSKFWMDEKSKPMESSGNATFKSILGGRYLQQEFRGEAMGQKFEGMGLLAYDNAKAKYESVWVDTWGTGIMKGEGTMNKKTIAEAGTMACPLSETKTREFKSEWNMKDKNNMVFTMFSTFPGTTKMAKQMEITYKRAK